MSKAVFSEVTKKIKKAKKDIDKTVLFWYTLKVTCAGVVHW